MKNTDSLTAAQRLATGIPHRVTRLKGPFSTLLCRVREIGIVTILSGNESAIQESVGIYDHMAYQNNAASHSAQASRQTAHQPLFYQKWKYGFAVSDKDD